MGEGAVVVTVAVATAPPHATPHAPGGSSSGSGVAVGAGIVPVALGSDTGGSVRIPAALCGTVGLKTTVGRISRAGVYPLSWTLDTVGPLTRSVEDAALVHEALQGEDPDDPTTRGVAPREVVRTLKSGVKGLRVAFGETITYGELAQRAGRVQAAGAHGIAVRGVDLCLVTLGKVGTKRGAEVLAAVAAIIDGGFDAVLEIGVIAALAEEMAGRAAADQHAVLDPPQGHDLAVL